MRPIKCSATRKAFTMIVSAGFTAPVLYSGVSPTLPPAGSRSELPAAALEGISVGQKN